MCFWVHRCSGESFSDFLLALTTHESNNNVAVGFCSSGLLSKTSCSKPTDTKQERLTVKMVRLGITGLRNTC